MEGEEFKKASAELSEYIVNYLNNIRERRVLSNVEPGYLRSLLPEQLPDEPEKFSDILKDVTHWASPRFHAFYPTGNSYPGILADMLTGGIGCIGFTWMSSPSCTELEVIMMDWLGELIGLPKEFLSKNGTNGGGMSASDSIFVMLLTAKKKKLLQLGKSETSDPIVSKFTVYSSEESHSAVFRAAVLGGVKYRSVPSDENDSLRGNTLKKYIEEDIEKGLIPFFVVPTLGTTFSCSFDNLREIGEVCKEFNLWSHVDAAYAGAAFVCEEYQYLMDGIELMDSFNFNPHKWMLKSSMDLVNTCNVDLILLRHEHEQKVPDYRHWQIPLGRRFRSLKLWFVMRLYGKSGIQKHIRDQLL
ncbi:Aromatic-L-amino-acid decarboxylase [Armadillidium vulgare]|nr:Aromatic-L-amino-acid decarboxylase [Armadillidium vulgare]